MPYPTTMADTALGSIPIPEDPNADRGPLVLYVVWILTGLSTLVVAARLYTKIRKTHRLYYDDGIMTIALVSAKRAALEPVLISI